MYISNWEWEDKGSLNIVSDKCLFSLAFLLILSKFCWPGFKTIERTEKLEDIIHKDQNLLLPNVLESKSVLSGSEGTSLV